MTYHEYDNGNGKLTRKRGTALGRYERDEIPGVSYEAPEEELRHRIDSALRFFNYRNWSLFFLTEAPNIEYLLAKNDLKAVSAWAARTHGETFGIGINITREKAREVSQRRMKEFGVNV